MLKKRLSFLFSVLLTISLWAGSSILICDNSSLNVRVSLGSSFGGVLAVYAIALGFATLGTTIQYFYVFADRGTATRPTMSSKRAWLFLGGLAVFLWVYKWAISHICS